MKYDPDIHHRRSVRLRGFDYSTSGAYFVTICVHGRECLFGDVVDGVMQSNKAGNVVKEWWQGVPEHFANVHLDEFSVMPNHFHGIILIQDPRPILKATNIRNGGGTPKNQGGETPPLPTLGQIVGYFKYQSTKQINLLRENPGCPVWQRNYYERVIRNEWELDIARKYIMENPIKWHLDRENPINAS